MYNDSIPNLLIRCGIKSDGCRFGMIVVAEMFDVDLSL